MKAIKTLVIAIAVAAAFPAYAASKTITLDIPSMHCEMCPITVKKALTAVKGVSDVNVDYDKKEAVVTFDDTAVTVDALTKATDKAGYPSTQKAGIKE
jgi:mercuric ion binding protein